MEKRLAELLYRYEMSHKYADQNFVDEAMDIINSQNDVSDYVLNIDYVKGDMDSHYKYHEKKIVITQGPTKKMAILYYIVS